MDGMNFDPVIRALLTQLDGANRKRKAADQEIAEISTMLQALPRAANDPDMTKTFLDQLDQRMVRDMVDQVRSALRANKPGMTPQQIKSWILMTVRTDLGHVCDAAIPKTLRYMRESGEVKEFTNKAGEKAYRMKKPSNGGSIGQANSRKKSIRRDRKAYSPTAR